MKPLHIAEPAARDLAQIVDYIAQDNPNAAQKVFRSIVAHAQHLQDFPALGRPGRYPATRELSIPSLPYLIVYEASAESVTILAVFHTSQNLVQAVADRMKGA